MRKDGRIMVKLKRSVIKEELVELTGNYIDAVLLNQFIYWSERVHDFDLFIEQENKRVISQLNNPQLIELTHGWIYKSAEELSEETMIGISPSNIRKHLKTLIGKGWLYQRNNPKYKWDRTVQYRVDLIKIQMDLFELGYSLEGYKADVSTFSKIENGISKIENQTSQNRKTIPETTTETKKSETIRIYITLPSDDDFLKIYHYYYQKVMKKQHPQVTKEQLYYIRECIDKLKDSDVDYEHFNEQVYEHFNTIPDSNNGNILAFLKAMKRYFCVDNPLQEYS